MSPQQSQRTMLVVSLVVLTLLISVVMPMVRPAADTEAISRAIRNASKFAKTENEELVSDWVSTLTLSGRKEEAFTFAKRISSETGRIRAYVFIADAHRELGQANEEQKALEAALLAARRVNRSDARHSAIALVSARNSNIDEAFRGASQITDKDIRSDTLSEICLVLIRARDFDAAARAARNAEFEWSRPRLMLRIAEALLATGQKERARAIAQEALDLALGNAAGKEDRDLLVSFAPTISKAGLDNELLDAFRRLEERDVYISDAAFEAIAVSFAESGATEKALVVARGITSATNDGRARALAAISDVLRRAGREDEAEQVLTEALEMAQGIQFIAHRSWALHKIAPMLVRVGRSDEALLAVRDLVRGDNEPLGFVAVVLVELGQWDRAKPAVVEVFASPRFENTVIRSGILIALVEATLKTGRVADALQLVELANQKLAEIQDPIARSDAFRRVAEAFAMVKKWDKAVDTAEKCEQQIDQLAAYTAILRIHSSSQGMERKSVE